MNTDKPSTGFRTAIKAGLQWLKNCGRRLFSPMNNPAEPAGAWIVTVRTPWGKSREVRLLERRGSHAMGETVDEGLKNLMLVQRGMVIPADVARFDTWFGQAK